MNKAIARSRIYQPHQSTMPRRTPFRKGRHHFPHLYNFAFSPSANAEIDTLCQIIEAFGLSLTTALEVACGPGHLSIELARRGYRTHGYDHCIGMISLAQIRAHECSQTHSTSFVVGDMVNYIEGKKFDLIFNANNSLNFLLDDNSIITHLKMSRKMIRSAGIYVVEISTEFSSPDDQLPFSWTVCDENQCLTTTWEILSQNAEQKRSLERCTYVLEGASKRAVFTEQHVMRCWTISDWKSVVAASGWHLGAAFDRSARSINLNGDITGEAGNIYYILMP